MTESAASDTSRRPLYAAWMRFAAALGRFNNGVVLGAVFFLLITPVGWLRRRLGGDPLARRFDPAARSYRKVKAARPKESLERPF